MSGKGGQYVLTASVLRRRDEHGVPRRFKRGDKVTLSDEQAVRLLAAGAVAKASSEQAEAAEERPGSELAVAPALRPVHPSQASSYAVAEANSGLGPEDATGGVLSDEQYDEIEGISTAERPPKSATVEVWRKYAVDSGAVTAAEAADMTKAELQDVTE